MPLIIANKNVSREGMMDDEKKKIEDEKQSSKFKTWDEISKIPADKRDEESQYKYVEQHYRNDHNKKALGVVLGIFFGLIGLLIAMCAYPDNTEERKTCVDGWVTGFIVSLFIAAAAVTIFFTLIVRWLL